MEEFRGKAGQKRDGARICFLYVHGGGTRREEDRLHIAFIALSAPGRGSCASEGLSVAAKGAVLIDAKSGRVLFGQNENERFPMASTTKIMTALLALESCSLDETVTASENASGVPGTSIYLGVGETLTMEEMLYGLLLRSGNDAAVAIAEHVAGSVEDFAARMNARAAELDADAHFENSHGLDTDATRPAPWLWPASSGRRCKTGTSVVSPAQKRPPSPGWATTFPACSPIKTACSRPIRRDGRQDRLYLGRGALPRLLRRTRGHGTDRVVLSCPNWFDEAERMLDWGFENYHLEAPLTAGEVACEAAVEGGMAGTVTAVAESGLAAAVGKGETWRVEYDFPGGVRAPLEKGEAIGTATLYIEGTPAAQTALLAGEDVEKRDLASAIRRLLTRWVLLFAT